MRLGVHVSIAGGLQAALERAKRLGCTTMQIFSRSPRGGPAPALPQATLQAFARERRAADITPLAVHSPYIINLASSKPAVRRFSVTLYQQEVRRCVQIGAQYLVTHVGSHGGDGEEAGIARVIDALNRALEEAPGASVMLLLENTAGSGQGLGDTFEQLAAMRQGVRRPQAVGICLDTAHLFAAGFPIQTAQGLDDTIERFDRLIGLEHLKLMHLNDSKVDFNSRVDRHWHIGEGKIGLEAMRRIVTHRRLREVPLILETPKKTEEDDPRNLATVRAFRAVKDDHARVA